MKYRPLSEQVVVVVGAASGIGRLTATELCKRGARLLVCDNDSQGLDSLVAELADGPGQVIPMKAEVERFEQMENVATQAVREFGRMDTWVHVAAIALYATFIDTPPEEFKRVIEVNLLGQVHGAKAALPRLLESGAGKLIHVSSIEAKRALPYHSAYASSKHGIDGFLEAFRVELRHDKLPIGVTQILPASINTPLFDKALTKIGVKPKGVPPIYDPSAVVDAILFATEHDARDIVVGGAGKSLIRLQKLSPGFLDGVFSLVGFKLQRTSEPRTVEAPNNFNGPAGKYNTPRGDFGRMAFKRSLATSLDTHPRIKKAIGLAGALGIVGWLTRSRMSHRAFSLAGRLQLGLEKLGR